jgi:hypothetical protein
MELDWLCSQSTTPHLTCQTFLKGQMIWRGRGDAATPGQDALAVGHKAQSDAEAGRLPGFKPPSASGREPVQPQAVRAMSALSRRMPGSVRGCARMTDREQQDALLKLLNTTPVVNLPGLKAGVSV